MIAAAFLAAATTSPLSSQPSITVRDSIVLQESGDDYLVLPSPVVPDGSGGYLVADHGQAGVFHYSGSGTLMRRYGSEGEGPGEWKEAGVALPWGDEHVMVLSWSPPAIHLFRRSDGEFVEEHPLNMPAESVVPGSGGLWASGPHYATSSAVRRLKLGESEARPVLRLPVEYTEGGPAAGGERRTLEPRSARFSKLDAPTPKCSASSPPFAVSTAARPAQRSWSTSTWVPRRGL